MIQKLQTLVSKSLLMLFIATVAVLTVAVVDATVFKSSSIAFADNNDDDDNENEEVEELEIEAERYEQVDKKWEIKAEVNGDDIKFYVYNIDDEEELISEIKEYINDKYDSELTTAEITDALEIDEDEMDEESDEVEELEIEAERYEQVDKKWEIKAEVNGDDIKFYVYNIDDEEELISEIKEYINDKYDSELTTAEITDALEIDEDEMDEESDEKGGDEDKDEMKEDGTDEYKESKVSNSSVMSNDERLVLIEKLQKQLLALMELLIQALKAAS